MGRSSSLHAKPAVALSSAALSVAMGGFGGGRNF
jgi:hypothetical protein